MQGGHKGLPGIFALASGSWLGYTLDTAIPRLSLSKWAEVPSSRPFEKNTYYQDAIAARFQVFGATHTYK
jgi:hypothetical protein